MLFTKMLSIILYTTNKQFWQRERLRKQINMLNMSGKKWSSHLKIPLKKTLASHLHQQRTIKLLMMTQIVSYLQRDCRNQNLKIFNHNLEMHLRRVRTSTTLIYLKSKVKSSKPRKLFSLTSVNLNNARLVSKELN